MPQKKLTGMKAKKITAKIAQKTTKVPAALAKSKSATKATSLVKKVPVKSTKNPQPAEKITQVSLKKTLTKSQFIPSVKPVLETGSVSPTTQTRKSSSAPPVVTLSQTKLSNAGKHQPKQGKKEAMATKAALALIGTDPGISMEDGRYALSSTIHIDLPKGYKPSPDEEYMNPKHLEYFRRKLLKWREDLVEESKLTIDHLRDEVRDVGDEAERATRETENSLELRTRDRYRKLIAKIDKALKRIEEGRYGYCEETDEEIGLERLEVRPIATMTLDAQERWEHRQKQIGEL